MLPHDEPFDETVFVAETVSEHLKMAGGALADARELVDQHPELPWLGMAVRDAQLQVIIALRTARESACLPDEEATQPLAVAD